MSAFLPPSVILPVIRRVMPSIIAHELVNIQPMSGQVGQIFTMKPRWGPDPIDYWIRISTTVKP